MYWIMYNIFFNDWIEKYWPYCRFEDKHLIVRPNQQEDPKFDINSLVMWIPCLQLNHRLDWQVTVIMWWYVRKIEKLKRYAGLISKSKQLVNMKLDFQLFTITFVGCFIIEVRF